ncbi:PH domain-containing protein [Acidobacteria bacterium AH-259-G07]|nr:PH domain-containing protein [Acidobacteria bacterium AH-259-G07]
MERKGAQGRFNLARDNKIHSALDQVRMLDMPNSIDGEAVIYRGQAAFDGGSVFRSSWKMGQLYLTKDKLLFYQGQNRIREIQLSAIQDINVLERNWVPGKKTLQLCLIEQSGESRRKSYFSVNDAHSWRDHIENLIVKEG